MNLEAEVQREKSQKNVQEHKKYDEKLTDSLKREAQQARKDAEKFEKEYMTVAEERDKMKGELEEMRRMYGALERRMKAGMNDLLSCYIIKRNIQIKKIKLAIH